MMTMWIILFIILVTSFCIVATSNDTKIVCYYYRSNALKVEEIDTTLCTHYIYAFVGVNIHGEIILNKPFDIRKDGLKKFNNLKTKSAQIKTLIAVQSRGNKVFSAISANAALRATFIKNVEVLISTYGFDGLDLDWEFPKKNDKENYVTLLKEIKDSFNERGYILSAAVAAWVRQIDLAYDVPAINRYLDILNVMTYDFHGKWNKVTGINAPLYDPSSTLNVKTSIYGWLQRGASAEKLVMGIPFYGRTFSLLNPNNNDIGAPITGAGSLGTAVSYRRFCQVLKEDNWTTVWSEKYQAPYSYKQEQWVSYDDIKSIGLKVEFAKSASLGGVMVWQLAHDDFKGNCGVVNPLLKTINKYL